ncbi:MAG: hypothetical protein A2406_00105 [Candidatus Komeilibacteria bacterium RIFOXYC1_FULL_37_11]|uniref:HTH cro/C1-type domain-containing protein n=1 Tax=Candidatus Komeilibacteria bacterium RIFOXYC1_FULL_37_11 TaxID=1798555 RepID=A0A1G2BWJ6_9BACT|nr:MAG: hypothetical protein A2406_00105 [Candidatus Komeilibacteria bacterium RIFOXYC1_FULL_37_11]OGY95120.1 MAG: hypothetical protein A2611_00200 [Candidatus Komeilibacteria bacterium RIFOXYD1_FULL_37_29]
MASFKQKKISRSQTLADKLRQSRLEQNKTLAEAEAVTGIQTKYLEILEEGNYQKLPGNIYAKAWLRLYANFLGLQANELLVDYKIEKSISDRLVKVDVPQEKNNNIFAYRILKPRVLKSLGIGLLIVALFAYLGWEVNNIISPPEVLIFEPTSNFKTTDSSVVIKGQTKPEVQLTINNELVLLDEAGYFSQEVNLLNGLNNLEISAKKKHSRIRTIEIVILRESLE